MDKDIERVNEVGYWDNEYLVSLYNYDNCYFSVSANNEQHALDLVADFCIEEEYSHVCDFYELLNGGLTLEEIERDFVVCGNSGLYVNAEHLHIERVE